MSVRIGPGLMDEIHAHLGRAYPEEGCGVLVGCDREGARVIERIVPLDNRQSESRERRYLIAPEQLLVAERGARAAGLDVVGFFHSHPDHPARPSTFDLEQAWPYYSYLIVSLERGRVADVRCWRLADDRSRFEPEALDTRAAADRSRGPEGLD